MTLTAPIERDLAEGDTLAFLHLAKTAGTTLGALLVSRFPGIPRCLAYSSIELLSIPAADLAAYGMYIGHYDYAILKRLLPPGFACVTVLRDPVERLASHVRMVQRQARREPHRLGPLLIPHLPQLSSMTLPELIADDSIINMPQIFGDLQARRLGVNFPQPTNEQIRAAVEAERTTRAPIDMQAVKRRLVGLTCFGLTERFQETLFLLCFTFGWRPIRNTLRLNTAPTLTSHTMLDPETLARMEALTTLDRELYAFARALFHERYLAMTQSLLERYGDRAHARLRPPLDDEVVYELLERHYAARLTKRLSVAPVQARQTFSIPLEGVSGWQGTEISADHGAFCWTGPGTTAELDMACPPGRDLQVTMRVLLSLAPDILESLCLSVNDVPIALTRTQDPAGAWLFSGLIPHAATVRRPWLRLTFSVGRTVAPATVDPTSRDERLLGVAVNWIEVRPAA